VHASSGKEARKPVNLLDRAILRHWVTSSKSYDVEFRTNLGKIPFAKKIFWNFYL